MTLDEILGVFSKHHIKSRREFWIKKYGSRKNCFVTHHRVPQVEYGCEKGQPYDECCEECRRITKLLKNSGATGL